MNPINDTIFACASAPGKASVSVLRVSGPNARLGLSLLSDSKAFKPRTATLATLRYPVTHQMIDRALVLVFKAPASYTGEDLVEYHLHGSRSIIEGMLGFLGRQEGHRLAEPGEFTRRAFENGKMDLTEAEAVADLIDAETATQRAQALAQMGGSLYRLYEGWSKRLAGMLAHLEADIEFPDEDMPEGIAPSLMPEVQSLLDEITAHLEDNRRGERLRDGIQVAVIGAPNAGKSSLVNVLAQRDVAIVSDAPGTTRDVIEVHLDIGGYPVILADTAGLRPDQIGDDQQGRIENEGIRRALERAENADIKLLLFDGSKDMPDLHTLNILDDSCVLVVNKSDDKSENFELNGGLWVSVKNGQGLDKVLDALLERIKGTLGLQETPSLTRQRHREALGSASGALTRAITAELPELAAEDLRLAMRDLGRITGKVDVEDLLDVIFNDFCIGK